MTDKPNIVFLHVDQLQARSAKSFVWGHANTPNMDELFRRGLSFAECHTPSPVCSPARTSWFTGRMITEHGVVHNGIHTMDPAMPDLGQWLARRGYTCHIAGRWHVPRQSKESFQVLFHGIGMGDYCDYATTRAAESFLLNERPDGPPFFLSVGLVNPHDICMAAFRDGPAKFRFADAISDSLPGLPATFDPSKPVEHMDRAVGEQEAAFYISSYCRMTEMVDAEIGRIMRAVSNSSRAANTILIFSSDHGEMLMSHNRVGKDILFDESVKVPLVIAFPDGMKAGETDDHLVSGLDITATILDYAGAPPMPGMSYARSLRPLVENQNASWREYVASEVVRDTLQTMIRTRRFKSIHSTAGEELYDLQQDPTESTNLASSPNHKDIMGEHRKLYADYRSQIRPLPEPPSGWNRGTKSAPNLSPTSSLDPQHAEADHP